MEWDTAERADYRSVTGRPLSARIEQSIQGLFAPEMAATLQWRSLGCKWLAAGALTLATLAAGVGDGYDRVPIVALGGGALLLGALMVVMAARLKTKMMPWVMVVGTFAVSAGIIVLCHTAHTPFILLYAWSSAEAWYLLERRAAVALTILAVVVSGPTMALAGAGEPDGLGWWLMVAGTLVVVSLMAATLRLRSDLLIERLEQAATHDQLTGLLNRRGYEQRLAAELARTERLDEPLSIVLGDIDCFKSLNDQFGHQQGDAALVDFARVCLEQGRGADFVARVGGEEFAVVLPGTDSAGALLAAERLRQAVRSQLTRPDGEPLSASFGVAACPGDAVDAEWLLAGADRAMYAAKAGGRDRCVAYADLPEAPVTGSRAGWAALPPAA
jgi:diguanylate cyclase (GGDEF)-like protein